MVAVTAFTAVPAQEAHDRPAIDTASTQQALTADLVKTGLYVIKGGGGNSLLRFTSAGSILVDSKLPGYYRPLMSQVRKISRLSDLPVRVLVVTDPGPDQAGNLAQFAAAGVATVLQDNLIASPSVDHGPAGKPLLPTLVPTRTYQHEYPIRMGGAEVKLLHFGNARTRADTVVLFPDLKVVAVGDLYAPDGPSPDFRSGGSLANWGPMLAQVLALDFDVVIPSQGPAVARADLEAFKIKVEALTARARALVALGADKNDLMARLRTDDGGWQLHVDAAQVDLLMADVSPIQ